MTMVSGPWSPGPLFILTHSIVSQSFTRVCTKNHNGVIVATLISMLNIYLQCVSESCIHCELAHVGIPANF